MEATAQLNVRLNPDTKASGESSIQAMGLSVTEFTRKLWDRLAQGGEGSEEIRRAVLGDETQEHAKTMPAVSAVPVEAARSSIESSLDALSRARELRDNWMAAWGYDQADLLAGVPEPDANGHNRHGDRQLAYDAMADRMRERGTL